MTHSESRISDSPILAIPTELIIHVFKCSSSLSEVLALAATCHRLQEIWHDNVTEIYTPVAARSISCEKHARRLCADQGGLKDGNVSLQDVRRILRNAHIVEKAIVQFEKEVVCKVKSGGLIAANCYGPSRRHPPFLTRSERLRFIRTYYQLWGLLKTDPVGLDERFQSMTIKQLYHLCEMCRLPQSIGGEEILPAQAKGKDLSTVGLLERGRPPARRALHDRLWAFLEQKFQDVLEEEADDPWLHANYDGYLWWIVIWDHWQPSFKRMVFCQREEVLKQDSGLVAECIWDDTSDEDIMEETG